MPATIATALTDLLLSPDLPLDEALDRHFAPDYRQRTDGVWIDRAGFAEHIAHLRGVVADGTIRVHDELAGADGVRYAERHTIDIVKADGSTASHEVYVFAERAPDGRFVRLEEVTLMVAGSEADRGLGSAR
ncbi:nuclear transport factor 2 family protein [Catenulispora sp. NF23]|uniref:Nuclear transport factor 2 family protein n=2 Tax=Catenulispora pinistramenti TaxID=2705254 RepID=A0ABS5KXS0_9ACTN|nr:nuclear transport factor 2 family protein [Catenulispora pinistramenti]MBS2550839.1 nuclear transport factor 2 family protein [Catenulispora pinistramenti]